MVGGRRSLHGKTTRKQREMMNERAMGTNISRGRLFSLVVILFRRVLNKDKVKMS